MKMSKNETEKYTILAIVIIALIILVTLFLALPTYKSVLCVSKYPASIGGNNEFIPNVDVIVNQKNYSTGPNGQTYIPLNVGETYTITAIYNDCPTPEEATSKSYCYDRKTEVIEYKGEEMLLISIDTEKHEVHSIKFVEILPK